VKSVIRKVAAAVSTGAMLVGAIGSADVADAASHHFDHATDRAVFVQTDDTAGNQIVVYDRRANGTLTRDGIYDTGGSGGALNGSVVDHLASQGSLAYDHNDRLLYAVNAGSNTVSVFSVDGDRLHLRQVISSGGLFPVSVAVHGRLVDVLNAEGGGSVQGYVVAAGHLFALPWSKRNLGLTIPTDTTQFTHTPGQVAFSPDGSQLIVTTKGNTNAIDVFSVGFLGYLSPVPVVNVEPGAVPFGVTFDGSGHLVVADTGTNSLATYSLSPSGTVTLLDSVPSTQAATCWVAPAAGFLYGSNAGSGTLSGYREDSAGQLTLLGQTATDPGTVDASASAGGRFLYVQTGKNGVVDEFKVDANGSLTEVGSVTVPNAAGGEGIVAS
jgi:6-phosphogluconolactonase (cycloisomerase 2 family)